MLLILKTYKNPISIRDFFLPEKHNSASDGNLSAHILIPSRYPINKQKKSLQFYVPKRFFASLPSMKKVEGERGMLWRGKKSSKMVSIWKRTAVGLQQCQRMCDYTAGYHGSVLSAIPSRKATQSSWNVFFLLLLWT